MYLQLHFTSGTELRLYRLDSCYGSVRRSCLNGDHRDRGEGYGLFPWGRGVRAMSAVVVRGVVSWCVPAIDPYVTGGRGSLAATLDGVLSKEPQWLLDCFGVSDRGTPISRRLFARSNPGRKRVGPVAVALAPRVPRDRVALWLNGELVISQHRLLRLMTELEQVWDA
ncbi:MAG: hypothetical protein RL518_1908 [Pseudomonadota bacterium]|jgi:hypothetical protein